MATTQANEDESSTTTEERERARERYEAVLGVVEHQTDNPASDSPIVRAGIRPNRVCLHLVGHGRFTNQEKIRAAIQAVREQGDLFRWRDREGEFRVSRTTQAGVEAVVARVNRWEEPDREVLELCGRISQEAEDE